MIDYLEMVVFQVLKMRWFSLGTSVSSTNKTDHCKIIEIILKVTNPAQIH
jgi:hypothetical protein